LETVSILACRAVLEKDGDLMGLNARFWKEWLPSSGYRRARENIPDIEAYPDTDMPKDNFNYELWFPVVKDIE
jgi:AraC family transcriptional regulator